MCAGTAAQGSFFSLAYSRGWLPLTVNTKSPPALVIAVAVSVWGVPRVHGDHHLVEVKTREQVSGAGDLVPLGRDGELSQDGPGAMVQGGDQMRRVPVPGPRPAHGLAVDRDHPPLVDQVGAGPQERADHPVQDLGVHPRERAPDR